MWRLKAIHRGQKCKKPRVATYAKTRRRQMTNIIDVVETGYDEEAIRLAPDTSGQMPQTGTARGPSQATRLLMLTEDIEFFHTPRGVCYASIAVSGHHETWPVRSTHFREWLAGRFYESEGGTPKAQAIQDALDVMCAIAKKEGQELPVFTRIAERGGKIYLDLGDPAWQAVEVTTEGWSIVSHPPVRFLRSNGMLALPAPVPGSQISSLRPFVNVKDEDFVLLVGWLIAAFRPLSPYPVLALFGEQGSAKSTTARVLRALVDPFKAPIRALPQNIRDLMISASCSHIRVAYGNDEDSFAKAVGRTGAGCWRV
jgi:ABC-type multidrug transport system fused ATPase/permease subunit